jgi:hypothetical protein
MSQTEYEKANRLYLKTLSNIHAKFADTIGQIWGVFMKDMETSSWQTKKRI